MDYEIVAEIIWEVEFIPSNKPSDNGYCGSFIYRIKGYAPIIREII